MAWNSTVDLYCERLDVGVFAEPLNAMSNLAFIGAALWLAARYRRGADWTLRTLAALLLLIGLGSAAFHLWARAWGGALDSGFIALFILFYLVCWLRCVFAMRWTYALLGIPVYFAFSALVTMPLPRGALNGSVAYLPALAALLLMAITLTALRRDGAKWFLAAAATFSVSLTLRSIDLELCSVWPDGTHWLWHCLNAVTLTLAVLALERQMKFRPA